MMKAARANVGLLPRDRESADAMAGKGRRGDNAVAHVTKGEMVLGREFMEKHRELIEDILDAMAEDGIDPRTRIVGTPQGPENPETGAEEFADASGEANSAAAAAEAGPSSESGPSDNSTPNTDPNSSVESDAARSGAWGGETNTGGRSGEGGMQGLQATYTGIGFIDDKINAIVENPARTVIDGLVSAIPVVGTINTVSGLLGGPTIGKGVTEAARSLSGPEARSVAAAGPVGPDITGRAGAAVTAAAIDDDTPATPERATAAGPVTAGLLTPARNQLNNQPRPTPGARFARI